MIMGKSFQSILRERLDEPLQKGERIDAALHYRLKAEMRKATMSGREFQSPEELALYLSAGRKFQ